MDKIKFNCFMSCNLVISLIDWMNIEILYISLIIKRDGARRG